MKTLRYIGMALFAMVLCVGIASCSDDDDEDSDKIPTNAELVNTSWRGTFDGASVTVTFESTTELDIVAVFDGQTEHFTSTYTYDEVTGEFATTYGVDNITGYIKGNTITYTLWGETGTLKKK